MLTLIHGDDTTKSRDYYLQERTKYPEKIILDGTSLALTDFMQVTSGNGIFGDQSTIFIENLLSKRKPSKELEAIESSILESQSQIVLYESKNLTPAQLKKFPKATFKQFSTPKAVFSFLDSIMPGKAKTAIELFHQLLKSEDSAFALFMLQRQVRILLSLTNLQSPTNQTISETSRLAPWQKGKLQKQSQAFSLKKLLTLHEKLYQLELAQKTGQLTQPLDQAIDFLLSSL